MSWSRTVLLSSYLPGTSLVFLLECHKQLPNSTWQHWKLLISSWQKSVFTDYSKSFDSGLYFLSDYCHFSLHTWKQSPNSFLNSNQIVFWLNFCVWLKDCFFCTRTIIFSCSLPPTPQSLYWALNRLLVGTVCHTSSASAFQFFYT